MLSAQTSVMCESTLTSTYNTSTWLLVKLYLSCYALHVCSSSIIGSLVVEVFYTHCLYGSKIIHVQLESHLHSDIL
jgi:hypothetical protein